MTSIADWLDASVKKGYGVKFEQCFEAIGMEDSGDIADLEESSLAALESRLLEAGALPFHLAKIKTAISAMAHSKPTPPGEPAPSADSPLKSRLLAKAGKKYAAFIR